VPRCVIGHSVGEVAAACVSGALDLEAAAAVVTQRGRLMQPLKGVGQMLAVHAPERELRAALADYPGRVGLAALNGPRSWVVSGEPEPLQELRARLEAQGFTTHVLRSAYAFHSPQTARLAPALEQALRGLAPRASHIDYISSVSAAVVDGATLDAAYWARNAAECVSFWPAVECAKQRGSDVFLELGPHPLLLNDIQASASREAPIVAIGTLRREVAELEAIADTVGALYSNGVDLNWASLFDAEGCVALPSCPWQHQDYWLNTGTEDTPSTAPRRLGKRWVAGEHVELVSQPGAHVFNGMLDKRLKSLLRGRQRAGRTLLTEALQLEALLQGAHGAGVERFALVELQLEAEVELGSLPQPMQTSLLPQWPGRWNIALHTRQAGNGQGQWQRSIGGVLLASEGASPVAAAELDLAKLDFLAPDAWLRRLSELGLELGKATVLSGVASSGDDTVLRLALPENARAEASDFVIHPALLDACFQLASVLSDASARLRRVARIERAQVAGALGASAFARVRSAMSLANSDSLRVDIQLFDSQGKALIELFGVELIPVGDAPSVTPRADAPKDVWLYDLAWQARPLLDAPGLPSSSGCWLVLADRSGVAKLLANELWARGERCLEVRVSGDAGEHQQDADALYVDPDAEGAFTRLLRDVAGRGFTNLRGIVHCWSVSSPSFRETSLDGLNQAERLGCRSLLHLVQALQRASLPRPPRLWVVTRGARAVQPADEPNLAVAQAPIWGFARGVDLELPEYECSLIDLDPHRTELATASVVDEIMSDEGERQVAFRDGKRMVARLSPVELPAPRAQPPVSADGTYLITGGLGGIGLEVAFWMAKQGARSLALLGRSAPSPQVRARLNELEQAGVSVKVLSADVMDPAALGCALAEARRESALKGIVHAAGVVDDGALLDLDVARLATVLAPKVQGAWNLDQLTRDDPLDFFVLFSSVASLLGNPGQTNYNAANCFLDSLSYARRGQGRPALAINWGPWAEVGMLMRAGDRLKKAPAHLVKLIAPDKGLLLLERLLGQAAAQVAVMPWDIPTLRRYYPAGPGQRLFAEHVSGHEGAPEEPQLRPSERPLLRQDYVAPRNETERLIAQIWQATLNLDQVGVCDNFFELGGDSVLGGQIISKINRAFSVSVNVRESFAVFTVAELASAVQRLLAERLSSLSDAEVEMLLQESGAEAIGSG
jgi:myxalamid-type polyketide synthase MxaD